MLFETLKNSLRAVVETHGQDKDDFPVTKVVVAEGKEDITIKISDEGGGIPRSAIPLVWTYMYTTVDSTPSLDPDFDKSDFKAPMAGFGYGLPISRLYAKIFWRRLEIDQYGRVSQQAQSTRSLISNMKQLWHRCIFAPEQVIKFIRTFAITTSSHEGCPELPCAAGFSRIDDDRDEIQADAP